MENTSEETSGKCLECKINLTQEKQTITGVGGAVRMAYFFSYYCDNQKCGRYKLYVKWF